MDPSQEIGDDEEYSSSESGWTKYIISHMSDDDDEDCNESENEGDKNDIDDDDDDDDDDDSMASDASTGPGRNKHYDEKDDNVKGSLYSCMKISKKEEKEN
ncbi:hypothetical protein IHE45_09G041300 [Dioscorea alata]|uniref:Uncharacterized protein n=1 Tax=Dioscorea alata TaxID=55571 RepID=A0ACB7VEX5_DIOAL|nr:hypothetical protein IHE45_09G041300 [Dioscorea alata]